MVVAGLIFAALAGALHVTSSSSSPLRWTAPRTRA
ncbi:DUF1304 domain-containing protein, partial [Rhodococcus hoagii]|nr:DUF1304 domain-containing protein [Prescottella equi]